jgi:hypothetical protein
LAQAKSPRCFFALGPIKTRIRRFGNIRNHESGRMRGERFKTALAALFETAPRW